MKPIKKKNFKEILRKIDNKYGMGWLEMHIASNWYNPFATIWLNFRCLSLTQAWRLPISVYGHPRFYNLSGSIHIAGKVTTGMITFNQTRAGSPSLMNQQSEIMNQGLIIFHGKGVIGTGNKIRIAPNATLEIGANFKITDFVNIGCYSRITIGELSRIVHRCQVLDSNYHYVANYNKRIVPKWTKPINIGKGCWICNSTTITGGAIIPDFTIVASNSLVSKDFSNIENNSMIGGIPAKLIATGFRRIENRECEQEIQRYYAQYPNGMFSIPEDMTMDKCSLI